MDAEASVGSKKPSVVLDLEKLVRDWVDDFELDDDVRKKAAKITSEDINWKHMRVTHGKTDYDEIPKVLPKTPMSPDTHVLFSAHFTNNTKLTQTYNLKTERRTTSTCNIEMSKCYTIGFDVSIKLAPPNPIIEANAGFNGEMSVNKADSQTFEEELIWSVDNQITVPRFTKTKADLVLKVDKYINTFKIETKFEGKIHVTLKNKKDNSDLITLTADVKNVFLEKHGFRVEKYAVYYTSNGQCKCKYGIEQRVRLNQKKLKKAEGKENGEKDDSDTEEEETETDE